MSVSQTRQAGKAKAVTPDPGVMKCELVLCLESGPVYELKWCPLPTHDPLEGAAYVLTHNQIRGLTNRRQIKNGRVNSVYSLVPLRMVHFLYMPFLILPIWCLRIMIHLSQYMVCPGLLIIYFHST